MSAIDYYMRREVFGLLRVCFLFIQSIMGPRACSVFATPGVMVLRLNKSFKYHELIPTPDCSGPVPNFCPFLQSIPHSSRVVDNASEDPIPLPRIFMPKEVHLKHLAT
jgi:hypothetical protein